MVAHTKYIVYKDEYHCYELYILIWATLRKFQTIVSGPILRIEEEGSGIACIIDLVETAIT